MISVQFLLIHQLISFITSSSVPVITQTPKQSNPLHPPLETSCQANSDPVPVITWHYYPSNTTILPGSNTHIQITKSSNHLSQIRITDPQPRKIYSVYCNASNSIGYAISPPTRLGLAFLDSKFLLKPPPFKQTTINSPVTLSCQPPVGFPTPKVMWLKNDAYINLVHLDNRKIVITDNPQIQMSILKIVSAGIKDSGSYQCVAQNVYAHIKSSETKLQIVSASSSDINVPKHKFSISSMAKIPCPIQNPGIIDWQRYDGRPLSPVRVTSSTKRYLIINNIHKSDAGRYVCSSSNNGEEEVAMVDVFVKERARFLHTPVDKTVAEGSDMKFECIVAGYPLPDVFWELPKLGVLFSEDDVHSRFRVSKDGSLHIKNVDQSDGGKYTCNCHSSIDARHASANLFVRPRNLINYPIISLPPQNQTLLIGSTATFRCETEYQSEFTISWFRGLKYESLNPSIDDRVSIPTLGVLQLHIIDPIDTNLYTCEISTKIDNRIMKTRWTAFLRVVYPDFGANLLTPRNDEFQLPHPPLLNIPSEQTSNSISISWKVSNKQELKRLNSKIGNNNNTSYWIEYVKFGSNNGWIVYMKDWEENSINVKELEPNSWYQFLVRSRNIYGLGRASIPTEYMKTLKLKDDKYNGINYDSLFNLMPKFSQMQLEFKKIYPILFGKIKVDLKIHTPNPSTIKFIDGFRVRYRLKPIIECLQQLSPMEQSRYCSIAAGQEMAQSLYSIYQDISSSDTNYLMLPTQSDKEWMPQQSGSASSSSKSTSSSSSASSVSSSLLLTQPNFKSGVIDAKTFVSKNNNVGKILLSGLNSFSCYELTAKPYIKTISISTLKSHPKLALILEDIPSRYPHNIRSSWSSDSPKPLLNIQWQLPPPHSWHGLLLGVVLHLSTNKSHNLLFSRKFNTSYKATHIRIPNLDPTVSYYIHMSLYNCRGEGRRSPRIFIPSQNQLNSSVYDNQPWFIPVIVIATLFFWILLCGLVVYLCCVRCHNFTKNPKLKHSFSSSASSTKHLQSHSHHHLSYNNNNNNNGNNSQNQHQYLQDINLEPLIKDVSLFHNHNNNNINNEHKITAADALYSTTSNVTSGSCTPYASTSIIDNVELTNQLDLSKFYNTATASIIDELGPQVTSGMMMGGGQAPPYLTYAPYGPHILNYPPSIQPPPPSQPPPPPPLLSQQQQQNLLSNNNMNNFSQQHFYSLRDDTCLPNQKLFSQSAMKMGVGQLPGSSSGASSSAGSGNLLSGASLGHDQSCHNRKPQIGAISAATLGSTPPCISADSSVSGMPNSGGNLTNQSERNKEEGEESPKSTIHYDVITNRETGDESNNEYDRDVGDDDDVEEEEDDNDNCDDEEGEDEDDLGDVTSRTTEESAGYEYDLDTTGQLASTIANTMAMSGNRPTNRTLPICTNSGTTTATTLLDLSTNYNNTIATGNYQHQQQQHQQPSPDYSTDSITYSSVPRDTKRSAYPKPNRRKPKKLTNSNNNNSNSNNKNGFFQKYKM